jgi:hypothetical protein
MSLIDVGCASTFEVVCIRLTLGSYHCVLVVIYRPGSAAVTVKFFTELADILDRVAVLSEPVFDADDVKIRLDRPNESSTRQLVELFASRGLLISATESTHEMERSTSSLRIALLERFQYLSSMLASLTTDYSPSRSLLMRLAAYRRLRECVGHGVAWHLMIFWCTPVIALVSAERLR